MPVYRLRSVLMGMVLTAAMPSALGALELNGTPIQGGLLVAKAAPGAVVEVDGRPVRVSPKGDFLVGFGRSAGSQVILRVRLADGTEDVRTLRVKSRKYEIQRVDGLAPGKVTPKPEDLKRIRAESAIISNARRRDLATPYFISGFTWPLAGRISGVYGSQRILNGQPRRPHFGVDITAPHGARINAPADGVVTLAHDDMFFTGKTLLLDHGHGLVSVYAHMSQIHVKPGQKVKKGDKIGAVGATGRVTGPHLHWGINLFNVRLDPALVAGPVPEGG